MDPVANKIRRVKITILVSLVFLVVVIVFTEFSAFAPRNTVAKIEEVREQVFISIGDGIYYDTATNIVYAGNISPFDYRVPVPLRTSTGGNYIYNPWTGEVNPPLSN